MPAHAGVTARPASADPASLSIRNITSQPQLAFAPIGTVKTVGAFARITSLVSIGPLVASCKHAANALKPWNHLAPSNSWARTYFNAQAQNSYRAATAQLRRACDAIADWDKPGRFFAPAPARRVRRYNGKYRPQTDQDHNAQLMHFATAPARTSRNRVPRDFGTTAIILGGGDTPRGPHRPHLRRFGPHVGGNHSHRLRRHRRRPQRPSHPRARGQDQARLPL